MGILLIFAFISGLITIAAPCIWPLLPIILSSATTGGHRKPLGITLGIVISFGFLTLFLSYIVQLIPINENLLRYFAVFIIGFLGIILIVPKLSAILEGYVSRFSNKLNPTNQTNKNGFGSGLITGIALGVVWTPCAGPILATIATLAATQKVSFSIFLITIVYLIGVAIPLFAFAAIGNTLFTKSKKLSPYTGRIQQVFGVIMLLTAIAIGTNYDKVLQIQLLNTFPGYTQFQTAFENNPAVRTQLNQLKNNPTTNSQQSVDSSGLLNANYAAPDFAGITHWLNPEKPLRVADLKGKVVLVDFWTYTCINCIRTLPFTTRWYDKYKDLGFVVIGVHTPEFGFEKDTNNVKNAITQYNIHYPVAQDNDYATWNAFNNEYWPAEYLIDANGNVRRTHFGEGEYDQTEQAIQLLLKDAGKKVASNLESMPDQTPQGNMSPETYLGAKRMQYYYPDQTLPAGNKTFTLTNNLSGNTFSYGGEWDIMDEYATAGNQAKLNYNFTASKVFLVIRPGTAGKNAKVKVLLDGKPVSQNKAGQDVKNGEINITNDRLYNLIDLHGKTENHVLELQFETPGTEVFAFTFG